MRHIRNSQSDCDSSGESSESEDEMKYIPDEGKSILKAERNLDTDAVNPEISRPVKYSVGLSTSDVREIEENLDDYEKVSLIFLLSDYSDDCLNRIELSKWAWREMSTCSYWEEKIWEALTIIKNFQIPNKYGFSKEELIREYFPFSYCVSKHIPKFKKILYLICENFKKDDENRFIQQLRRDLRAKSPHFHDFPPNMEMEMYFSFLLKTKYISENNTKNCMKIAKMLDLEIIFDLFEHINNMNENRIYGKEEQKSKIHKQLSKSSSNMSSDQLQIDEQDISLANSESTQDNFPVFRGASLINPPPDHCYKMNGNKICYIINQMHFFSAPEPEYQHLLPPNIDKDKLHPRLGSKFDSDRLKSVFEKRNFKVYIDENLFHWGMIEELKKMVESIDKNTCSCFFVIILSHGNQGVVYGSNSCYVEISSIINTMDNKKFFKIPKILILQTCQGPNLQYIEESLTTDGDESSINSVDPKAPDFLLFSSTVPGFASIRDKNKGTWFIQDLCDEIEKTADKEHFLDICTNTTGKVESRKWVKDGRSHYQIAYTRHTFTKKLYI